MKFNSVTDLQTDRATTRGPSGPKNKDSGFVNNLLDVDCFCFLTS